MMIPIAAKTLIDQEGKDDRSSQTPWKYPKPCMQAFNSTGALSKKHLRPDEQRLSLPVVCTPETPSKTAKSKYILPTTLTPFALSPHVLLGGATPQQMSHISYQQSYSVRSSHLSLYPDQQDLEASEDDEDSPFAQKLSTAAATYSAPNKLPIIRSRSDKRSSSPIAYRNSPDEEGSLFGGDHDALDEDPFDEINHEMDIDTTTNTLEADQINLPWKSLSPTFFDQGYFTRHFKSYPAPFIGHSTLSSEIEMENETRLAYSQEDYFSSNYDTLEYLGNGSFSSVWKVRRRRRRTLDSQFSQNDEVFACKKSKEPFAGMADRERRLCEVENMWMVLGKPNCLQIKASWEQNGHLFILSEYCENGSLKDVIEYMAESGSRFTEYQIWNILRQLSIGLVNIHQMEIVHLDLKPANILIDGQGNLKIADFGLSWRRGQIHDPDAEGDKYYMAPEVLEGAFEKPADVFSLGLLILELATDVDLPAQGDSWQNLRHGDFSELSFEDISDTLNRLIKEMSDPNPDMRPTAEEVLSRVLASLKNPNQGLAKRLPIYAFHSGLIPSQESDMRTFQIMLWFRNWYRHGFMPRLLDENDAAKYQNFTEYRNLFATYPTVNHPEYEMSCYLRWLAYGTVFGQVDEMVYFSDYDILNLAGIFTDRPELDENAQQVKSVGYKGLIPTFINARKSGIEQIIRELATYKPDLNDVERKRGQLRPHVSDMTILRRKSEAAFSRIQHTLAESSNNHGLAHFSHHHLTVATASLKDRSLAPLDRRSYPNDVMVRKLLQTTKLLILDLRPIGSRDDQLILNLLRHFSCERTGYLAKEPQIYPDREYNTGPCMEPMLIDSMPKETTASNRHIVLIAEEPMGKNDRITRALFGKVFERLDPALHLSVLKEIFTNPRVTLFMADQMAESKLILEYDLGMIVPLERKHAIHRALLEGSSKKAASAADAEIYKLMSSHFRAKYSDYSMVEDGWRKKGEKI